ncbi:hypothetical protein GCM10023322_08410 [Rugosimonospora acidiphila]|uniref:Uncharacterized protein n=1 Tax=Rugosimonospora acidiphila TaxID=556531 RepID=A0ABP9RLI3_9ACTN
MPGAMSNWPRTLTEAEMFSAVLSPVALSAPKIDLAVSVPPRCSALGVPGARRVCHRTVTRSMVLARVRRSNGIQMP